ncbi:MAG: bifunctional phosphoribosylaminoimidazolecarboxamide formyltransferase/IMP cyclohydrolase [Gemmatimonadetes bacterium]|nr:bifunctional phosphoribosylaminoimidazolecarboxamide formyltransferase/IMP cyclohydrolase [Gemmatimonadota bacterium]
MPRALISVYDKTGIIEFARGLVARGWEIVSTGGTAKALRDVGIPVHDVSGVTGFPEIMGGRVKTLHPAILAGILARRDEGEDAEALRSLGIVPIDLVAVNLYPFEATIARAGVTEGEAVEQVDVGGPTMLRAAAKNFAHVIVVCDPSDYEPVLHDLERGGVGLDRRRALAVKAFTRTAAYDAVISGFFGEDGGAFAESWVVPLRKAQDLRYGENPDQQAALYAPATAGAARGLVGLRQHQGKELSYNNLLDLDGALMAVAPFSDDAPSVACAIVKHTTPCGLATGATALDAYRRALATDPESAFGSVIALTATVDGAAADAMADLFVECLVAPGFTADALERLSGKKNLRILTPAADPTQPGDLRSVVTRRGHIAAAVEVRGVLGGLLAQSPSEPPRPSEFRSGAAVKVVTRRAPTDAEWQDLAFAWAAVWSVKSNAIVLARDGMAIGIGAGQMSRVDSCHLAVLKAHQAGHETRGSVLASDAFFPFRDGVDVVAEAGVTAIVQPGGSVRDPEVIAAADEHGMSMVLTGRRLFRH